MLRSWMAIINSNKPDYHILMRKNHHNGSIEIEIIIFNPPLSLFSHTCTEESS